MRACHSGRLDDSATGLAVDQRDPATGSTVSEPATPTEALAGARARWDATGLDTYRLVFQNDCGECDPEWAAARQVVVWDGASFDGVRSAADVASLFELIERALAEGSDVEVSYGPRVGIPQGDLDRP